MQPYFNDIAKQIKSRLLTAEKSIDIAVSWFTNSELLEPLLLKLKENVDVQLIIVNDTLNINPKGLNFQHFIDNGGKLFLCNPSELMHNKYCIIDNKELFSGSYNWTYFAETKNFENILFSTDSSVVKQYIENFESIKQTAQITKDMNLSKPFAPIFISEDVVVSEQKLSAYQVIKTIPSNIYNASIFYPATGWGKFKRYVTALDVSSNKKYLASAGGNWTIQIWEIETGKNYYSYEIEDKNTNSYPSAIKFSPDSTLITMSDGKKGIVTLSVSEKNLLYHQKYSHHCGEITYSLAGDKIAICSTGKVYIVEAASGELIETVGSPFIHSRALEFMDNDTHLLIASQGQGFTCHLKLYSLKEKKFILDFKSSENGIKAIKKLNEQLFIASGWSNEFYMWDIRNAFPRQTFKGHKSYIFDCDVDPISMRAVTGSIDTSVKLWDLRNGNLLASFNGHKHGIHSVRFDTKHSVIFSSDEEGKILTHTY